MTILSASLGFPRIGPQRELKRIVESYWQNKITASELESQVADLRKLRWTIQRDRGLDLIPSNDFSLYDHVLDMSVLVGAIPDRFQWDKESVDLDLYFAMARGSDVPALEMTKWFDTNYHYLVPEFHEQQSFKLSSTKPIDEFREALAIGIETVPVILGPLTFLLLGKSVGSPFNTLDLLPRLLPIYEELLTRLREAGATWVQIDEPCLALDRSQEELEIYRKTYAELSKVVRPSILLTTYFAGMQEHSLSTALSLPVQGLHLDLVRGPQQLETLLGKFKCPNDKYMSLGLVDGRNVWKNDLANSLSIVRRVQEWQKTSFAQMEADRRSPHGIIVAPSCSLLHVPWDAEAEMDLNEEVKDTLSFAVQKLGEIQLIKTGLNDGLDVIAAELRANEVAIERRRASTRVHDPAVRDRLRHVQEADFSRKSPFAVRKTLQQARFNLPLFPTTTIGSFPQTKEVRQARSSFRRGSLSRADYEKFLEQETAKWIKHQETLDIDVLVHGEFERTDMVEYFGEQLEGFAHTKHGWVQSYGTRCVKPPIIYGDVSRPDAMTVKWSSYAQSLTDRPVKGMLTGPVTILQWSFVRDDQPREITCLQIALALRDEVCELERAGIAIIQVDEPALREGLPLHKDERASYLTWSVNCFRLATSGVQDDTQIHTHMCYAEFNDIMPSIQDMDADVISIETSRSNMELLNAFAQFSYQNDIGPGVYDIHSPRVPSVDELIQLLDKACEHLNPRQLWVNPDCGLKTRGEAETLASLSRMIAAARHMRQRYVGTV